MHCVNIKNNTNSSKRNVIVCGLGGNSSRKSLKQFKYFSVIGLEFTRIYWYKDNIKRKIENKVIIYK